MGSWLRIHKVNGREVTALVLAHGDKYQLTFAVTGAYPFPPDECHDDLGMAKGLGDTSVQQHYSHSCQANGCEDWKQFAN